MRYCHFMLFMQLKSQTLLQHLMLAKYSGADQFGFGLGGNQETVAAHRIQLRLFHGNCVSFSFVSVFVSVLYLYLYLYLFSYLYLYLYQK